MCVYIRQHTGVQNHLNLLHIINVDRIIRKFTCLVTLIRYQIYAVLYINIVAYIVIHSTFDAEPNLKHISLIQCSINHSQVHLILTLISARF